MKEEKPCNQKGETYEGDDGKTDQRAVESRVGIIEHVNEAMGKVLYS